MGTMYLSLADAPAGLTFTPGLPRLGVSHF